MLSGERDAGERFVAAYYAPIERMQRCLTGSSEIARDLTQQTFVKAWQALPGFKFEASLSTWLHRIAYHEYTHWLRARKDHAPLAVAENIPGPTVQTDWGIVLLPNALAQLTDELREVFLLYYVQELSVPEVASVLGIPAGTVKSRLYTARQQLRTLLDPSCDADQNASKHAKNGLLQAPNAQPAASVAGASSPLLSPLNKIKGINDMSGNDRSATDMPDNVKLESRHLENIRLETLESGVGR